MYINVIKNINGSYTFDKNGMPYNAPNSGEWVEEYAQVHAWAQENPSLVQYETPAAPKSPEEAKLIRAEEIKAQLIVLDNKTVRPLRALQINSSSIQDLQELSALEQQVRALRDELTALGV